MASKIKQVEDALEAARLALGAAYYTIEQSGDTLLLELFQKAIIACQNVLHDPNEED